jgi:hypothetical protein
MQEHGSDQPPELAPHDQLVNLHTQQPDDILVQQVNAGYLQQEHRHGDPHQSVGDGGRRST